MAAFGRRVDIPGGRRNGERSTLRLSVSLQALNCSRPATLLDLSRAGAKMSTPEPMYRGQEVWLKVGKRQMFGTVRWVRGRTCGVAFDELLSERELAQLRPRDDVVLVHRLSAEERMALADWRAGSR